MAVPEPDSGFVIHPVSGVRVGRRQGGGGGGQWERRTSPGPLFGLAQQNVEGRERPHRFPTSNFSSLCFYFNILIFFISTLNPAASPSSLKQQLMISPD